MHLQPKIVATMHSSSCLKKLQKKEHPIFKEIDFLEVRLDAVEENILPSFWPCPVIATARDPREGGRGNLSFPKRKKLLEDALLWAAAIDVEIRSRKLFASTLLVAKESGKAVIASFHDFENVPSLTRLEKMALQAQEMGADFFKVACTMRDEAALIRLLAFQLMMREVFPVATMGMGPGAKVSRLLLAAAGSALNYGWLYTPQMEGQWSAQELVGMLSSRSCRLTSSFRSDLLWNPGRSMNTVSASAASSSRPS